MANLDDDDHVANAKFGDRLVGEKGELDALIGSVDKLDSISAQLVLGDIYDTEYGITDHGSPNASPLSLVGFYPKEDYHTFGPMKQMFYKYVFYDVYKHTGLSLTEFLALPREYTSMLFDVITDENLRLTPEIDNITKNLNTKR